MKKTTTTRSALLYTVYGTLFFAALLFSLYTVSCLFFVPYYLSKTLPQAFFHKSGLLLEIDSISCNPFTLRLQIDGIEIRGQKGEEYAAEKVGGQRVAAIQSIRADFLFLPLLRAEWVCSAVDIYGLQFDIIRLKNKQYTIDPFFQYFKKKKSEKILEFAGLPFYFSFNNITVQNSIITFTDRSDKKEKKHCIKDIVLHIPTIANISKKMPRYLSPYFSAVINDTPIEITGKKEGKSSQLSTTLYNFPLQRYIPYSCKAAILC